LSSDGRSNINHDPLLALGVQTANGFAPLGTHDAGTDKKSADYLRELSVRCLDNHDLGGGFGDFIYANVMDGAPACISAMRLLEEEEFLVPVRCASHALALHVKHVVKKDFPEVLSKATTLISFIRNKSRVHGFVRTSAGRAVFRFVDTRFLTHVVACMRLLELKPTLRTMVEEEEGQYRSWANTQPAKTKAEIKEFEAIVSDQQNKFWKQMSFMVECLQPASQALRLMDQSRIRAKDVNNIWNGLEKRLTLTLADDRFKDTDQGLKVKVLQQFVEERERAQYPVFDAAWALDPCNHAELLRLGQSSEAVDLQKWRIIQDNTEHTLLTIACRKIKVDDPEVRKAIKRLKLDSL